MLSVSHQIFNSLCALSKGQIVALHTAIVCLAARNLIWKECVWSAADNRPYRTLLSLKECPLGEKFGWSSFFVSRERRVVHKEQYLISLG